MTSYDGKAVTYDAIGNPLTYDGWNYTWEMGKQLATMSGNGYNISYKYNDSGIRTSKTVNEVSTNYHLVGDKVTYQTDGTDSIYYTYDAGGELISMNLNGVEYYYIRNGQSDIIGLFDNAGTQIVSYSYDTWGKLISITGSAAGTVGVKNPYRYRGYRYDTETGYYYCQSRYYVPEWGRWLNADTIDILKGIANNQSELSLLDVNLFAYCGNNPVMNIDPEGDFFFIPFLIATAPTWVPIAGMIVCTAGAAVGTYIVGKTIYDNVSYAKDDTKQTGDVTKGMTKNQREEYSKEVHRQKKRSGRGGKDNLPWWVLKEIADEIRENYK